MRHPVSYAPSQNFGDNPTSTIKPGSPDYWIIQRFGNYQPDGHTGTDYPCPAGTPVRAAAAGTVLHVGWMGGTYADNPWWIAPGFAGYCAVIDHGHFIGIYGHCMDGSAGVRAGDRVAEGDVFIRSGNTGASTGDHLHFECLPDGYILNSYMYGRINPASLFRGTSISTQSSTIEPSSTPIEEDELAFTISELLNTPAYDGGPTVSQVFKNLDDSEVTRYIKGDKESTLYDVTDDGKLRPIILAEWQATGRPYRTLPQVIVNALPKTA